MPVLPHIEISQLICTANQLTGFYMRVTLALNGLKTLCFINFSGKSASEIKHNFVIELSQAPVNFFSDTIKLELLKACFWRYIEADFMWRIVLNFVGAGPIFWMQKLETLLGKLRKSITETNRYTSKEKNHLCIILSQEYSFFIVNNFHLYFL